MSLSCGCDDFGDDAEWWYICMDFKRLDTKLLRWCKSCGARLPVGSIVRPFIRWRVPRNEVEIKRYGREGKIPLAPWYLCERCGGIYSSLAKLGFCIDPGSNMDDQLSEYYRDYAKPPAPGFTLKLSSTKPIR